MAGVATPAAPPATRVDGAEPSLRHLVWLKWTLTRRGLARDRTRLVGAIVLLLLFAPLTLALSILLVVLFRELPRAASGELLHFVLACLFAGWIIVPIFLYALNDMLDSSRLFLYPISAGRIVWGLLVTSVLDLPALFLTVLFGAIVVGWGRAPMAIVVAVIALVLLFSQMVAASQAVLSLLNDLLRSRRFRDVSLVALGIVGSTAFFWQQFALQQVSNRGLRVGELLRIQISPWLGWTPPGMAANAIVAGYYGDGAAATAWLALSAAVLAALLVGWRAALVRFMTTAESGGQRRAVAAAPATGWRLAALPLPASLLAVARKDLQYYWRDPQLKSLTFNTLLGLTVLLLAPWLGFRGRPEALPANWLVLTLPLPIIVTALALSFNAFGMERDGLRFLFMLPAQPRHLFLGKNIAVGVLLLLEAAVASVALVLIGGGWERLPVALVTALSGTLVTLAVGNVVSVLLPARMPDGLRATYGADTGCARGVLQFVAFIVVWVLMAPIGLAMLLPDLLARAELHLLATPLALTYAVAVYWLTLRSVAPLLTAHMPEILAITTRE